MKVHAHIILVSINYIQFKLQELQMFILTVLRQVKQSQLHRMVSHWRIKLQRVCESAVLLLIKMEMKR